MSSELKTVGGKKRQRSENWLEEDKIILKELVRERVLIIENKNTDANVNAKKVAAWHDLLNSFNNMANTPRSLPQIKAQWGIIKMTVKKQKFIEKKRTAKTGGGPPPTLAPATCDDLTVWLPHEFTVDSNEFDSDNQYIPEENTKEKITEQPRPEKEMHIREENMKEKIPEQPRPEKEMHITEENTKEKIPEQPRPEKEMLSPSTQLHNNSSNNLMMMPPSTSTQPAFNTPANKLGRLKKYYDNKNIPAKEIAANEIACRTELHEIQMAVERQKLKNLQHKLNNTLLKEEVLKLKLLYYTNEK